MGWWQLVGGSVLVAIGSKYRACHANHTGRAAATQRPQGVHPTPWKAAGIYREGRYKLRVKLWMLHGQFNRCYFEVAVDASKFRVSHAV